VIALFVDGIDGKVAGDAVGGGNRILSRIQGKCLANYWQSYSKWQMTLTV